MESGSLPEPFSHFFLLTGGNKRKMFKLIKETAKSDKGQAFMEFALMVPLILFLIIVGIILALAINAKVTLSNASHEAGRVAAVTEDTNEIRDVAKNGVLGGGLVTNYDGMTTFNPKKDVTIEIGRAHV